MEQDILEFLEINNEKEVEIIEKKSRFIATLKTVHTIEEAQDFLQEKRKIYWDARHHCSAWILGIKGEQVRCSDDGEPAQTAGKPMLDILQSEELRNVCLVVTRYFGGTLLGTGGLVRAYQKAAREAVQAAGIKKFIKGSRIELSCDYTWIGKIQFFCEREDFILEKIEYEEQVHFYYLIPEPEKVNFIKGLVELSNGRIIIEERESLYFHRKEIHPIKIK